MVWESESTRHLLDVKYIRDGLKNVSMSQEYTPKEYSSDISLSISKDDKAVMITPYTIETLKRVIDREYHGNTLNELFVGVRKDMHGTSIDYVGDFWTPEGFDKRRIHQYFFSGCRPHSFNFGNISGPGWPTNLPAIVNESLMKYYEELKEQRPEIVDCLDRCMEYLTRPGPEYNGNPDGSIRINLRR